MKIVFTHFLFQSLILKYKGNEYKDIDLDPLLGSSTRGTGIFVTHNGQIELEANVFKFYKVTGDPIEINKFTKIRFDSNKRPSTDVLKLCMYDSSSDFECVKYCHSISDPGFQTHDIFASELFASRKVNITHIAFEQACSNCVQYERSFISNLQILEGTVTDSYKDGKCTDVNAVVVASNNELVCKCSDGYISSSGRKLLDNEDSCVKCVGGLACNAGKIADDVICFNVSLFCHISRVFSPQLLIYTGELTRGTHSFYLGPEHIPTFRWFAS